MSRVRIGGAGDRRNVRPCRMQQRTVRFFRRVLKMVMVAELSVTGDREFHTAGAVKLNALDWKLILVAG